MFHQFDPLSPPSSSPLLCTNVLDVFLVYNKLLRSQLWIILWLRSILSCSDPGPPVETFLVAFSTLVLKLFLSSKTFPPQSSIPSSDWSRGIMTTRCLAVTGGGSIAKCDRLSAHYNIVILTYLRIIIPTKGHFRHRCWTDELAMKCLTFVAVRCFFIFILLIRCLRDGTVSSLC